LLQHLSCFVDILLTLFNGHTVNNTFTDTGAKVFLKNPPI
jgi:hypothetical protein